MGEKDHSGLPGGSEVGDALKKSSARKAPQKRIKIFKKKAAWIILFPALLFLMFIFDFTWVGLKKGRDPVVAQGSSGVILADGRILRLGTDGSSLDVYDSGEKKIGHVSFHFKAVPLRAKGMTLDTVHNCLVLTEESGRNRVISLSSLPPLTPVPAK